LGITINEYLTQTRLNYATKLLSFSDLPITEICYACGFTSFTNFSRAFKNKYHQSPSAYRKQLAGNTGVQAD
jgi:transcriptional regulator GlxA family with amidase domain